MGMLLGLSIQDFALIKDLDITCGSGLTIVSGETGAGKSIFLDAISFISGQRASRELVRKGQKTARVDAIFDDVFHLIPPELCERCGLEAQDLEDGQLLLSRELDSNGRSTARVNGRLVTITVLRELGDLLFAIHAQNEQVTLFQNKRQRLLLDRYTGSELTMLRQEWQTLRQRRITGIKQLSDLGLKPEERQRELEILDYQIAEIASSYENESDLIQAQERFRELANAAGIRQVLAEALRVFNPDEEVSVLSLLNEVEALVEKGARHSQRLENYSFRLTETENELRQQYYDLLSIYEDLNLDEAEYSALEEDLKHWDQLAQKYGPSWQEVAVFAKSAEEKADFLRHSQESFNALRASLREDEHRAEELAKAMHELRTRAARQLEQEIETSLHELNMPYARFEIRVDQVEAGDPGYWGVEGRDEVEFYISTNKGEDLLPLAKIASGGESSRILLAIKEILARLDHIPVLIFDEIDSGISGDTAQLLGQKLVRLSREAQVIAVTHTAQIAAMADQHFYLYKQVEADRTETCLEELDQAGRIKELSRLLVGTTTDDKVLGLAAKLLGQYNQKA
ncbi:MAG: DNA repair protein RecN [Eubacteriales bacterium]|nr:DNA repair protein RecN [Eubacteriales bacterium]